ILRLCTGPAAGDPLPTLPEVETVARNLVETLKDLHDSPGYHPAHDQVVAIAVRPLAEQVFRWQQRLTGARGSLLRLELDADHVEWFPARLRHILDNLFAHALRFRDPTQTTPWVSLGYARPPGRTSCGCQTTGSDRHRARIGGCSNCSTGLPRSGRPGWG